MFALQVLSAFGLAIAIACTESWIVRRRAPGSPSRRSPATSSRSGSASSASRGPHDGRARRRGDRGGRRGRPHGSTPSSRRRRPIADRSIVGRAPSIAARRRRRRRGRGVAVALFVPRRRGLGPPSLGVPRREHQLASRDVAGATVLTSAQGSTLYWFSLDTPTASKCTGSCTAYWPPIIHPSLGTRDHGDYWDRQSIRERPPGDVRRTSPLRVHRRLGARPDLGQRAQPERGHLARGHGVRVGVTDQPPRGRALCLRPECGQYGPTGQRSVGSTAGRRRGDGGSTMTRISGSLGAVVVAGALALSLASAAGAAPVPFALVLRGTHYCISVENGVALASNPVDLAVCSGTGSQQFFEHGSSLIYAKTIGDKIPLCIGNRRALGKAVLLNCLSHNAQVKKVAVRSGGHGLQPHGWLLERSCPGTTADSEQPRRQRAARHSFNSTGAVDADDGTLVRSSSAPCSAYR